MENRTKSLAGNLERLWSMEQRIVESMPAMIEKVFDHGLKNILRLHYAETLNQTSMLRGIFKQLNLDIHYRADEKFDAILADADKIADQQQPSSDADLLIITICKQIEEHEIRQYTMVTNDPAISSLDGIRKTLHVILNEEKLSIVKLNFAEKNISEVQARAVPERA